MKFYMDSNRNQITVLALSLILMLNLSLFLAAHSSGAPVKTGVGAKSVSAQTSQVLNQVDLQSLVGGVSREACIAFWIGVGLGLTVAAIASGGSAALALLAVGAKVNTIFCVL